MNQNQTLQVSVALLRFNGFPDPKCVQGVEDAEGSLRGQLYRIGLVSSRRVQRVSLWWFWCIQLKAGIEDDLSGRKVQSRISVRNTETLPETLLNAPKIAQACFLDHLGDAIIQLIHISLSDILNVEGPEVT